MSLFGRKLVSILLIASVLLSFSVLGSISGTPATPVIAADVLTDFTDPPGTEWAQLLGLDDVVAYSAAQTPDGYIVAGTQ